SRSTRTRASSPLTSAATASWRWRFSTWGRRSMAPPYHHFDAMSSHNGIKVAHLVQITWSSLPAEAAGVARWGSGREGGAGVEAGEEIEVGRELVGGEAGKAELVKPIALPLNDRYPARWAAALEPGSAVGSRSRARSLCVGARPGANTLKSA